MADSEAHPSTTRSASAHPSSSSRSTSPHRKLTNVPPSRVSTHHPRYSTHPHTVTRPLPFVHPTHAEFTPYQDTADSSSSSPQGPAHWSSRASRKNRYSPRPVHVSHRRAGADVDEEQQAGGSRSLKDEFIEVEQRLRHPGTKLKVHLSWDVSFWVAVMFTLGSISWIINGFFLYLPLLNEGSDNTTAAAWCAFAGGTLFELGAYLMYVESLNTGHEQLFGPALWGLVGRQGMGEGADRVEGKRIKFRWIGLGSWRELGFTASFIQWWAASIFWISTLTGLPNIIPNLATSPPTAIADVFYWTPQVIGGTCFVIASILLMLEEQRTWWRPSLSSLGWHVGLWNLVGAAGFTLCGALGYASLASTKVEYQSVLATFWGSWAFLIGSVVQLWETLWRGG